MTSGVGGGFAVRMRDRDLQGFIDAALDDFVTNEADSDAAIPNSTT
jgi:hypothetical protein